MSDTIAADLLKQTIEGMEQLAKEKSEIAEQEKELLTGAQSGGLDKKIIKKLLAQRKKRPDELSEEETMLELYKDALSNK